MLATRSIGLGWTLVLTLSPTLADWGNLTRGDVRSAPAPQGTGLACEATICNVGDTGFVAAWTSDTVTTGWVDYGPDPGPLGSSACDQRETGAVCAFADDTHFVRVVGLTPGTSYQFQVMEGGFAKGGICTVSTGPSLSPRSPETRYGRVLLADGVTEADGTFVTYLLERGTARSALLCDLIEDAAQGGYWALDRNGARTEDLLGYFFGQAGDLETHEAFGGADGCASQQVDYSVASPVPDLVLGPCALTCLDNDGDGLVTCDGNCTPPAGVPCGDCDDTSSACTTDCTDADADGVAACLGDCNESNPAIWSTPGEVQNVGFVDASTLTWSAPANPGGTSLVYDTLRSSDATNFLAGTNCVEFDDGADLSAVDPEPPLVGEVFHYLVRAQNDCPLGEGTLGQDSGGTDRPGRSCP